MSLRRFSAEQQEVRTLAQLGYPYYDLTMDSTFVSRKRKGRPPTGTALPETAVRLAPELLTLVDKWASKAETNRSEAIRQLVEIGLKAKK